MPRSLLAFVVGAAAGTAITYFTVVSHVVPARGGSAIVPDAGSAAPAARRARPAGSARSGTAERAALYRSAADADGAALEQLLADAAALPPSPARSDRLDVLLARYAELDPAHAVAMASGLRVEVDTLAKLYAQWASEDSADAVAALASVNNPAAATAIALAMVPALGGDDYALKQVLAAVPSASESSLRIAALAELANTDPAAALDQAIELEDFGASGLAIERIGATWARRDVRAALAHMETIEDIDLRNTFQDVVLRTWAQFDSTSFIDYVLALDSDAQRTFAVSNGLQDVARLDPERAFALAPRMSSGQRQTLVRGALEALARRDPVAALERLRTLPAADQPRFTRQSIARAYGRSNPEAALAWARSTGDRDSLVEVLNGIATTDTNQALDLVPTLPAEDQGRAYQNIAMNAVSKRDADFEAIVERLLAVGGTTMTGPGMPQLFGSWIGRSPDRAIDWIVANAARLPPAAFQQAGRYFAQNDPAAAERRLAQVPNEGRAAWLQGVAQGYAQSDPQAGASWVERLRGDPAFPIAAGAIAQGLAQTDAPAAAELLDSIANRGGAATPAISSAANGVATSWARTNPVAAAEWARDFGSADNTYRPLTSVAQIWGTNDYPAARDWTLRQPTGQARDLALRGLLVSNRNSVDASLLQAFSSDQTRQEAVVGAVMSVASRDPAEARALVDRYVTRPELRQNAERMLDQAANNLLGGQVVILPR